jgi:hypothetical protein
MMIAFGSSRTFYKSCHYTTLIARTGRNYINFLDWLYGHNFMRPGLGLGASYPEEVELTVTLSLFLLHLGGPLPGFLFRRHQMVRVDLFHPPTPSIYGTATPADIVHVCLAALGFNAFLVGIFVAFVWFASRI